MIDEQKMTAEGSEEETEEKIIEENDEGSFDWALEAEENQDKYLRAMAEIDNLKRRFSKEKQELLHYGSEQLLKDILPVLDNLELALEYLPKEKESNPELENLAQGVKMTLNGAWDVLKKHGLTIVDTAEGCLFDPNYHEAMGKMPKEDLPEGTICLETKRGYVLKGRLIRPAQVMVACRPEQAN